MENNLKEIIKPVKIISSLENEKDIIESKSYNLSLLNEEYELIMNINNIYIEFKLIKKNIICPYYYKQKYDLKNINKLLYTFFNEIKDVYNFYDKILIKNKVKLILIEDKINLNFKNIINLDNEIEINLEFKKIKINKDDILYNLINEVNILKNKINENKENKMKEYINNKDNEIKNEIIKENKKIIEEKINIIDNKYKEKINEIKKEYEDKIKEFKNKQNEIISEINKNLNLLLNEYKIKKEKLEIKLKIELNDNVNLINDFKCYNINTMNNNIISNNLDITFIKSVAVYNIIKNNEILYEIAYPDNKNGYNIIIYNILLNNITNKINNAHSNDIHKIKHYYNSLSKNHLLLTSSSDKSIKIWNISSNPISNILEINDCFDGDNSSPFCMLFNIGEYFILGGSYNKKKQIWNKNGNLIGPIEKSNLNYGRFIETTYIENKPYVLLSGENHSECYDYNNNIIKTYKSNKYNNQHRIINLFKKNEIIYLISGDSGGNVIIFDFISTNEISSISVGNFIYSLCSLNEKYILVGSFNKELKIIDFDNKSIVKNYSAHNNDILGIEKIKIPEKGEYIITYDGTDIKLWQ